MRIAKGDLNITYNTLKRLARNVRRRKRIEITSPIREAAVIDHVSRTVKEVLDKVGFFRNKYDGSLISFVFENQTVNVRISNNEVEIIETKGILDNITFGVKTNSKNFWKVIMGQKNIFWAFIKGEIRTLKIRNSLKGILLIKSLKIKSPWYLMFVDHL